ncbi:MAG: hypothetical protein PHF31_15535 [Methylobacter sp.]|jgi:hypothetical protein|nr:hypothetical protein [Methylobacter sp.]
MVSLIRKTTNKKKRVCNATCYNAKGDHCDCICGGHNHGVGLRQAAQNTADRAEELLKEEGIEIPEMPIPGAAFEPNGEIPLAQDSKGRYLISSKHVKKGKK